MSVLADRPAPLWEAHSQQKNIRRIETASYSLAGNDHDLELFSRYLRAIKRLRRWRGSPGYQARFKKSRFHGKTLN
jgi:hypothetical protein